MFRLHGPTSAALKRVDRPVLVSFCFILALIFAGSAYFPQVISRRRIICFSSFKSPPSSASSPRARCW